MGERKVLQHYYPPNFDPSLLPRRRSKGEASGARIKVRMPMPLRSIRCKGCNEYIAGGTRFNAWKEVAGESYLGISVYRLIFRCKHCHQEIAIKTSPNTERGYALDYGAVQGLDYAAASPVADNNGRSEASAKQEEEEDQFERLERSTEANKREEDSYRRLEELCLRNAAIDQYTASSSSLLLLKRKRTDKENDAEEKGSSSSDHALWLKAARTTELATTEDDDEKRVTTTTRKATRSSREKASRRNYRPRITAATDNKAEAAATNQKQDSLVDY